MTLCTLSAQAIHAEAGPLEKDVALVQMEKELNHVPRREIDRSVEVLHFVGGEDSSRRVALPLAPPARSTAWSTGAAKHALPAVAPATAVQFLTCFSV